MNDESRRQLFSDRNPFSTSAIKPGAIPFIFPEGQSAALLVSKLRQNEWRGEIVGPHGSGKSTLLQTLLPLVKAEGKDARCYTATAQSRALPIDPDSSNAWSESTLVVVEGFELLSRGNSRKIETWCNERKAGLLITCHASQRLPLLYKTDVTLELAKLVVAQVLPEGCELISQADIEQSFSKHGQCLRELLFGLYDLYEQRRRQ